jgi:hypothetical protein
MIEEDLLTHQSLKRSKIAISQGRQPFLDGRPPYLNEIEHKEFQNILISEAISCHPLNYKEAATIVFLIKKLYFNFNFNFNFKFILFLFLF